MVVRILTIPHDQAGLTVKRLRYTVIKLPKNDPMKLVDCTSQNSAINVTGTSPLLRDGSVCQARIKIPNTSQRIIYSIGFISLHLYLVILLLRVT